LAPAHSRGEGQGENEQVVQQSSSTSTSTTTTTTTTSTTTTSRYHRRDFFCQNKFFSLSSFSLDENKLEPCQRCSSLFSRSRRTGRNKNDDTAAVL
jgi:hypothetical protein